MKELCDRVPDSNDAGSVVEQQVALQTQLKVKLNYFKRLSVAINKVAMGEFGFCEDCGIEIPEERLQLIPDTPCCVDCQTLREHKQRAA